MNVVINFTGSVNNAVNDKAIPNAEIALYTLDCDCKPEYKVRSDDNGFVIRNFLKQPYILRAKAQDFTDYETRINDVDNQLKKIILSPNLRADSARIILSWSASPTDLDSHLWGPTNTTSRFHSYFLFKEASDGSAILDIDKRQGFGPETVTIKKLNPGRYRYAVHNFNNEDPAITTSKAKVIIVQKDNGGDKVLQFDMPKSGAGTWWHLFEMVLPERSLR